MIVLNIENKNLRIIILTALLFIFNACANYDQHPEISEDDKKRLTEIDNIINTDFKVVSTAINGLIYKAKINNDSLLLAHAYLRRGIVLTKKGEYKNSIDTLKKGVKIIKDYKDLPLKNLFFLRLGNNYALDDKSKIALQYYLPVFEDAKKKNNSDHLYKSSANIAKITRNAGKYEEALKIYKTTYEKIKELDVPERNIARILMGIGGTYLKLQKPDSALYYSNKGLEVSKSINDKFGESYFYNDFGIAYFLKGDYKSSLENLDKAETYIKSINNTKRLSETLFYKGSCYYKSQTYEKAIVYFEKTIDIVNQSEKLNNKKFKPLFLENTYDLLSKCYLATDNIKQSNLYETKRNEFSFLLNKENNQIVDALHDSELRLNEDFINKIEKANAKLIANYKWVLLFVGLVLAVALYFVSYYREALKNNQKRFENLVKSEPKKPTSKVKITNVKVEEILQKLEKIEEQGYYLESTCTLAKMAKKVNTNGTYLTKVLKEHKGKTFYEYINELRINYAINRLKTNKQFRKYAIVHVSKEVGYKSPESFTKHFKNATGINPSYYIKELEKLSSSN